MALSAITKQTLTRGLASKGVSSAISTAVDANTTATAANTTAAADNTTARATNSLVTAIADPGDGEAIPITVSGTCQLVSGGAETRTLAIPTTVGQLLCLVMKTDGGDITLTVASAINAVGNNTLVFGATSDTILLVGIDNNGTMAWRVMGNDGVDLSTV